MQGKQIHEKVAAIFTRASWQMKPTKCFLIISLFCCHSSVSSNFSTSLYNSSCTARDFASRHTYMPWQGSTLSVLLLHAHLPTPNFNLLFTIILLLVILFCLSWLILCICKNRSMPGCGTFLNFNHHQPAACVLTQQPSWTEKMEIKFGFAILVYYTWWLIVLLCMIIVLYKLLTN